MTRTLAGLLLAGGLLAPAVAAEDDLAVVKRAVHEERTSERVPPRRGATPTWLHVRVQEKGEREARVSVNVPLALVAALGDDCPRSWHCEKLGKDGKAIGLSELLAALEAGQELVQIESEEKTVRVWVD